jgi:hypothetical protein
LQDGNIPWFSSCFIKEAEKKTLEKYYARNEKKDKTKIPPK